MSKNENLTNIKYLFQKYWKEKIDFWREDEGDDYRNIFSSEEIAYHAFEAGRDSLAAEIKYLELNPPQIKQ